MATEAGSRYAGVVERRGGPARRLVAIFAHIAGRKMRHRLTRGLGAVVAA